MWSKGRGNGEVGNPGAIASVAKRTAFVVSRWILEQINEAERLGVVNTSGAR